VSVYRFDDRAIGVRSPAEAKEFSSSLHVQTSSEAHPSSYPMGTVGPFPGSKAWPGRDRDHSPHLVRLLLFSPLTPAWRVVGQLYFLLLLVRGLGLKNRNWIELAQIRV
jgi:hypothetical protein